MRQLRLYYCIGHVTQAFASLEMLLRMAFWEYFLPADKQHQIANQRGTTQLLEEIARGLARVDLPLEVRAAADLVFARVRQTAEHRNRVVHDYWSANGPGDPELPDREGASVPNRAWTRLDVRAPLGEIRATQSDLTYVAECLTAIGRRADDVNDLLVLVSKYTPLVVGGAPSADVEGLLGRIRARV